MTLFTPEERDQAYRKVVLGKAASASMHEGHMTILRKHQAGSIGAPQAGGSPTGRANALAPLVFYLLWGFSVGVLVGMVVMRWLS